MLHEDIDPRKATNKSITKLSQNLFEMTLDIEGTLQHKLQPIYSDLYKNKD